IRVRAAMSTPRGPSVLTYHQRQTLFIKVVTDSGLVGWGETYPMGGVQAAIRDVLAPLLLGRDPLEWRRLHREMLLATFNNGFAVGGLDLALHDLWGKALGVPVHALYGGAERQQVGAYASLPGYLDDRGPQAHWLDEAEQLTERGFRALKFRIGRFPPHVELPALARVREKVGPEIGLMADANAAHSPAIAVRVGRALRELDFDWLEEPLPQTGYAGYPELRTRLEVPLAGGEGLATRAAAHDALQRGCFDVIQPDVSICGGIAECLLIGELARLSAVRCIPHCWGGGVMLAATLQVCALLPDPSRLPGVDSPLLEYDVTENPFQTQVCVGEPFALNEGSVAVPSGPGRGIEIDESVLQRYAC
ncbi:MAG TPA: mandelate racemase/muconate lactonizing enzyme family protein, partial [Chloroflexota bacterium]